MDCQSSRLDDLMLNDKGFVFDPNTGESYQLNATGLFSLRGLQRGGTTSALVAEIAETFDVEPLEARCDLDAFLWELKQIGWL